MLTVATAGQLEYNPPGELLPAQGSKGRVGPRRRGRRAAVTRSNGGEREAKWALSQRWQSRSFVLSETVGTLRNTSQVGTWLPLIGKGLSQCVNVFNYVFLSGALMHGLSCAGREKGRKKKRARVVCSGADTRRPTRHQTE